MKRKNLTSYFVLVTAALLVAHTPIRAAVSPSEVNIKIYELWISPNADCSGLTRVYNEPDASAQNMVNGPTFANVNVANGTYHCVAWRMSDIISYRPAANDGNDCVQGVLV